MYVVIRTYSTYVVGQVLTLAPDIHVSSLGSKGAPAVLTAADEWHAIPILRPVLLAAASLWEVPATGPATAAAPSAQMDSAQMVKPNPKLMPNPSSGSPGTANYSPISMPALALETTS